MYNEYSKFFKKSLHPVRFSFVNLSISIKDQEHLKQYLIDKLNVSIRVKREHGRAIFLSSLQSNDKCKKYFFDNFDILCDLFNIKDFELEVDRTTVS